MDSVIFTEEQLQQKLKEWQRRLRLQDWIVTVRICRDYELEEGCQANVYWILEKKIAEIRIMNPNDYNPNDLIPQDMENSLVHELLHLHFASITNGSQETITQEEQAIESITSGLLSALREGSLKEVRT